MIEFRIKKALLFCVSLLLYNGLAGQQQYSIELNKIKNEEQMFDAYVLTLNNKFDQAISIYNKLEEAEPKIGVFPYSKAKIYLEDLKDVNKAEKSIERALKLSPDIAWYWSYAAFIYAHSGDINKELEANAELVQLEPNVLEHRIRLAKNFVQKNQLAQAISVFDDYEAQHGASRWAIMQKHQIYAENMQVEQAIEVLESWLKVHPNDVESLLLLALYEEKNDKINKAKENYKRILSIDKDQKEANLFMLKQGMQGSNEKNLAWFENDKVDINVKIGYLLSEINHLKKPSEIKDRQLIEFAKAVVIAHPNDAKAYAVLADLYSLNNRLKESLSNYKKALQLDQNHFAVWENALNIANEAGNDQALLELSEDLLLLFPEKTLSYWFSGLAKYKAGKNQEALDILTEGQLFSRRDKKIRARMEGLRAICQYLVNNQLNKAKEILEEAQNTLPDEQILLDYIDYFKARFEGEKPRVYTRRSSYTLNTLALAYYYLNQGKMTELEKIHSSLKSKGQYYNEFLKIMAQAYQQEKKTTEYNSIISELQEREAFTQ